MICYHCEKNKSCPTLRTLYCMSKDFTINDCKDYDAASYYKYKKIAEQDDLMRLIYDYFTGQLKGDVSKEQAEEAIIYALWQL